MATPEVITTQALFALEKKPKPILTTDEIMGDSTPEEDRPFMARNPNLYALGKTAMDMVPYLKYVDPDERDKFMKLSENQQTRTLLLENLNAVAAVGAGPILKGVGAVVSPLVERLFPKTFAALSKSRSVGPDFKSLEGVLSKEEQPTMRPTPVPEEGVSTEAAKPAEEAPTVGPSEPEIVAPGATSKAANDIPTRPVQPSVDYANLKPSMPQAEHLTTARILDIESQTKTMEEAIASAVNNPDSPIIQDQSKRIFRRIAQAIDEGNLTPDNLQGVLTKYGITEKELAEDIIRTGTYAGKTLNQLSNVAKALKKVFPKDSEAQAILAKTDQAPATLYEWFADKYRSVDNVRRTLMVGQVATAARNAVSQAGRYAIGVFDDAIKGTINVARGSEPRTAYADFMSDFGAVLNRMSPEKRTQLEGIFKRYPLETSGVISAPVHDIAIGNKISRVTMFLNTFQEYAFRKMAFDAKITSLAKAQGFSLDGEIPEKALNQATKHALEMTFSDKARTQLGNIIMQTYQKVPFLTMIQPYPRFWLNSLRFLWDFNPTGYITAAHRGLMLKNTDAAVESISKATLGTIMLGVATEMRSNPELAGERYYEVRIGTDEKTGKAKYLDTRAFAPFSSYLFLAEQMLHPDKVSPQDRIQGAIGINRIGGTGLVVLDLIRANRPETVSKMAKEVAGQWLGGFTVPLRSIKDLTGEASVLSTREDLVSGPALSNVPVLGSAVLPEAPKATSGGQNVREQTVLRQLTGLTIKSKNEIEREIDRLGVESLFPRTGEARLDRMITEKAGPLVEKHIPKVLHSTAYQKAGDDVKKYMLNSALGLMRKEAKERITIPFLKDQLSGKGYDERLKAMESFVDRKVVGASDIEVAMARMPLLFKRNDWMTLGRKALLK
jgi:hypothetical protein